MESILNADTRKRYCTSRCHNAVSTKCTCICGGKNHGIITSLFDDVQEITAYPILSIQNPWEKLKTWFNNLLERHGL